MSGTTHIFLGALCAEGFCSCYGELLKSNFPGTVYILKGCSGSGKSTFLKRAAREFTARGYSVQLVHCSFDPDSLDGVICQEAGIAIVDGTAPHVLEPVLTGTRHRVIALYRFLDENKLAPYSEILEELLRRKGEYMKKAQGFVKAASTVCEQLCSTASEALLTQKNEAYFTRLAKKLITRNEAQGRSVQVYASAVTPLGTVGLQQLGYAGFRQIYAINDLYLCAASAGLAVIAEHAVRAGWRVEIGKSPVCSQSIEYLAVPELSLMFCTNGFIAGFRCENAKAINCARFYDQSILHAHKNKLSFCKQVCTQLTVQAQRQLRAASELHSRVEGYYSCCVDFKSQTTYLNEQMQNMLSKHAE